MELQYYNQFISWVVFYVIGGLIAIYFCLNLTKKKFKQDTIMFCAFLSWLFVLACVTAASYYLLIELSKEYESIKRKYGRDSTDKSIGPDDKREKS